MIRKTLKIVFTAVSICLSIVCLWLISAWALPYWKTSPEATKVRKPVTVYVRSNGVHTDLVIPRTGFYNFNSFIPEVLFPEVDASYPFVAIGWGDKGFYLDTPTWDDLKVSTAFNAAFGLGSTAMHVTYYKAIQPGALVKEIHLSESEYQRLITYIRQSFKTDQEKVLLITHPSYGEHDQYFEAKGTYSLFKTCNVWTGRALQEAGIPIGIWTPLAGGIMSHL